MKSRSISQYYTLLVGVCFACSIASSAVAQKGGGLIVDPKRLVFENGSRSGGFAFLNSGPDTVTYSISLIDMKMDEEGSLEEIKDSSYHDTLSGKKFFKYYPHEVTLAPNESQTIRVQALKPADLPPGEYRSHLYIVPHTRVAALEKQNDTGKVKIKIEVLMGTMLPIIFRNGTTPSTTFLSDLLMQRDTAGRPAGIMSLYVHRSGNQSVYGRVVAKYVPNSGQAREIGFVSGVGAYVGLDRRHVAFPVDLQDVDLSAGKIVVSLETLTGSEKETVMAQADLKS